MISFLSVFAGGGIGSLLRYAVCKHIGNHWAILIVNAAGAMLVGMAYQFFSVKVGLRAELRQFIMTGLLGGFTTFSTYMLDFGLLVANQKLLESFIYLVGTLVLGIVCLFLGMRLMRFVLV